MRVGALWLVLAFLSLACSEDREPSGASGGVHPDGWALEGAPAFHATWLASNAFPLARCQQCHGADFGGGAVGVACAGQSGCHAARPDTCTTCHGSRGTPRPATGAHWAHDRFCDTCHHVPTTPQVALHASGDAGPIVQFSGLATSGGAQPTWDGAAQRCSAAYCHHGSTTPAWTDPSPIGCDGCHDAPPASHARWSRLTSSTTSCTTCHPGPTDPRHVDGHVDLTVSACTTCHGADGHANPPVALDGSTDPGARGVGAHQRHLDGTLTDRISRPLPCNDCHVVPAAITDPGHLDGPTTRVRFPFGGAYDATSTTCTVWCHFERTPGPTWTDSSGAARACGACHEFPPKVTRAGTPHPSVAGDLTECVKCHVFSPATHVNGVVDFAGTSP